MLHLNLSLCLPLLEQGGPAWKRPFPVMHTDGTSSCIMSSLETMSSFVEDWPEPFSARRPSGDGETQPGSMAPVRTSDKDACLRSRRPTMPNLIMAEDPSASARRALPRQRSTRRSSTSADRRKSQSLELARTLVARSYPGPSVNLEMAMQTDSLPFSNGTAALFSSRVSDDLERVHVEGVDVRRISDETFSVMELQPLEVKE